MGIENNPPIGKNRYQYIVGPNASYTINTLKLFGSGDNWYNSILSDYFMSIGNGRKDYYLDRDPLDNISKINITKKSSLYHKTNINAPTKIFGWINLKPHIDFTEYWIWTYREENSDTSLIEKKGFKRRLTWNSSISANTKIYGLLPINIGRLNAIRHIITPTISYSYTPDFSNPKFGYFQQDTPSGEPVDYFQDYSGTSKGEIRNYTFSINNLFQAKMRNEQGEYEKANFLTWNSSITYNPIKQESPRLTELISNLRVKNLSGNQLVGISMRHNFYRLDDGGLINIWGGEFPRLTYIKLSTDVQFKLFGSNAGYIEAPDTTDTIEYFDSEFYNVEDQTESNNGNNLWETYLDFRYNTTWSHPDKDWDYTFSLNTTHKINLSKGWSLSYTANFNLKEKEMTQNKFSIYRPLHCWEFRFSFWPQGISSGFSLEIKVKNPDLQDIKVRSSSHNRGFSSY